MTRFNKASKFILFCLFLTAQLVWGQNQFAPKKSSASQIILDGIIKSEEWKGATQVELNFEINPGNNTPAQKKTVAYITYTDTDLYIGIHAFDDPENIRANVRSRDDFNMYMQDDIVNVSFDTYADGRNNYILVANPFGSQFDVRAINALTDDQRYDGSFNMDFETVGSIVTDGFQVEYKIPFSSLPFPNGENQKWHFKIGRKYFNEKNVEVEVQSQTFDRNNPCEVCQTSQVLILNNITIKKRVELLPYVAGNLSGKKPSKNAAIDYESFSPNAGLGLNLDLSKNSGLEITLNPDFSQVEADVTQIDVNSSFALEYPERRPFFNRGTDIVNFTDGAFYSRSINNPLLSTKLLSQAKKSRIYFLTAIDQNSPYQIAGEDRSYLGQGGQSFVNVFRYQRLVNKNTRLGLISTNRYYKDGGYGNLFGTDGWFLISKNWRLTYELLANFNQEPKADWIDSQDTIDGRSVALNQDTFSGSAVYVQLSRNTEHWKSYAFFRNITPEYQANVGFVVKNNRRWGTIFHEYQNFINKKGLQFFSIGTKADLNYTFQNYLKAVSIDGIIGIRTYLNTTIEYTYDWDIFKNYLGRNYRNVGKSELIIQNNPSESFSLMIRATFGKDIAYNEENPEIGREFTLFVMPSFQLGNKFNLSPSVRYARLKNLETQQDYFSGAISRFSTRYQFNNFFSVRIISEYNSFADRFFIQPLIQWNPNPATVFYIGGNQNSMEDFNDEFYSPFRVDQTQFYLKFQYLIGL
ncbi:carbohydrate binding family 9 domain-containing protein [Flavobacteriaceae bacterium]|nr:carbohydrate binding family 9 domain-containing protein [Flavobacteriaceae bacterium]MDC3353999.1 carbohydrate binding family 9 domain-containing protein [Flavobacteriaceae bacterium]